MSHDHAIWQGLRGQEPDDVVHEKCFANVCHKAATHTLTRVQDHPERGPRTTKRFACPAHAERFCDQNGLEMP